MGSMLGDWPSFDPHNFSQLRPSSDPSNPSRMTPVTYHPTHDRTLPPPDQDANIIHGYISNVFYWLWRMSRPKRAASENPGPEHGVKHPRASTSDTPL
ncbi:hypothetical protein LguiB_034748 [Lonicera macranthoides]